MQSSILLQCRTGKIQLNAYLNTITKTKASQWALHMEAISHNPDSTTYSTMDSAHVDPYIKLVCK